jgi:NitT/TauT family transport system permease protein
MSAADQGGDMRTGSAATAPRAPEPADHAHAPGLAARVQAVVAYYLPSVLVMIALVIIWQLSVTWLGIKEYILPTPSAAFLELFDANYRWTENLLATLYAVLGAFVLSAVLGIALAVVVVWNDLLLRTVMPVLVLFNTLPKIALAPLFVVWLGYGIWPNILIGTTIAFFPMVVNTAVGLAAAEPEMLDLVRTLRASRWQVLRKIRFPNAIPYIFVGLKLAATMSVIGALVGEFVASERGLGSLIITGGVTMETASIFASLILISVLGLVLYGLVVAVERLVAPWAHREDTTV